MRQDIDRRAHASRRARLLAAGAIAVVGLAAIPAGATSRASARSSREQSPRLTSTAACATAVQKVFAAMLRGGASWHAELLDEHPLVPAGGASTTLAALARVVQSQGLVPACPVITVSYAAQSLDVLTLFGGPGALTHIRTLWDAMSPTKRREVDQQMDFGIGAPLHATIVSHHLVAVHGASQEWHVVISEHQGSTSGTTSETLTVTRIAGRWYATSLASLGASFG